MCKGVHRTLDILGRVQNVVTDRGTHFKGEFSHFLATHGINHRNAPLESPQTIGKVERHGGILKAMLRKTVQETLPSNIEEMEVVLSECVTAKNELARHQGFSPAQHVLGKQPRVPGSLTDEGENFGKLTTLVTTRRVRSICATEPEQKHRERLSTRTHRQKWRRPSRGTRHP